MAEQNFANHMRFYPLFHFFVLPVMGINLVWTIYRLWRVGFSYDGLERVLVAAGLVAGFLTARIMALSVQNRVIRLEERLRCERVLPGDLKPRIGELSVAQLVGLRFASDAELPGLVRKVLDDNICEGKEIKQMVKTWRPDYLRA